MILGYQKAIVILLVLYNWSVFPILLYDWKDKRSYEIDKAALEVFKRKILQKIFDLF